MRKLEKSLKAKMLKTKYGGKNMLKKKLLVLMTVVAMFAAMGLTGCNDSEEPAPADDPAPAEEPADDAEEPAAPGEEDAAGFDEFPIGDDQQTEYLNVAGVYFQPVDMEPAGNSIAKEDADCHIEADISANEKGATLGYGVGDFVPWLTVKAYLENVETGKVQEVAFMPMNASDGPHYGANIKFDEGIGKYNVKVEIAAPGNDYLLHVDETTGVTGRFWTEPYVVEWKDFEWNGPQW